MNFYIDIFAMLCSNYRFNSSFTAVSDRNSGAFTLAKYFPGSPAEQFYGFFACQTSFK